MILSDVDYRILICAQLKKIVLENADICSSYTVNALNDWFVAFIENSDHKQWDVNLRELNQAAIELLVDFNKAFTTQWNANLSELGGWVCLHKIIQWREHREVNIILKDLTALSTEVAQVNKYRVSS